MLSSGGRDTTAVRSPRGVPVDLAISLCALTCGEVDCNDADGLYH